MHVSDGIIIAHSCKHRLERRVQPRQDTDGVLRAPPGGSASSRFASVRVIAHQTETRPTVSGSEEAC